MDNNLNPKELNSQSALDSLSFFDVLNLPVPIALAELTRRGIKTVKSVKQTARETFQAIADQEYLEICRPLLTLDDCVRWIRIQKTEYPHIAYLFIYVERNNAPRNENDIFSIAVAGVDAMKKAIPVRSASNQKSRLFPSSNIKETTSAAPDTDIVCIVIPAKTIDEKLIRALNGNSSVLIKL